MSFPDYSIGFVREEVEEILAAQKAELKRTLAAWSESGSSITKRRIDEIHAIIAACQAALKGGARNVVIVDGRMPGRLVKAVAGEKTTATTRIHAACPP